MKRMLFVSLVLLFQALTLNASVPDLAYADHSFIPVEIESTSFVFDKDEQTAKSSASAR